jgi:hypothetical protein
VEDSITRVQQLCRALDVETFWVDRASSNTPSIDAKNKIEKADFLIAFCTRKDKVEGSPEYLTSTAVREEIAFAKAMDKRVICFFEEGVRADGFAGNMYTYSYLQNAESLTPTDLFDITQAIHRTKLHSVEKSDDVIHSTGIRNFSVSNFTILIELANTEHGLLWDYVIEKSYSFEAEHNLPLTHSAFCLENLPGRTRAPLYELEFRKNGNKVSPELSAVETPGCIEIKSTLVPAPRKGDNLFVRERYRSPYLAPIHAGQDIRHQIARGPVSLDAYDGICVISRIQTLRLIYQFPQGYDVRNLQPIVSTFSWSLDDVNEAEVSRLIRENCFRLEEFNNRTRAELIVERPLYQYFYGLGWTLPSEDDLPNKVAQEGVGWS